MMKLNFLSYGHAEGHRKASSRRVMEINTLLCSSMLISKWRKNSNLMECLISNISIKLISYHQLDLIIKSILNNEDKYKLYQ